MRVVRGIILGVILGLLMELPCSTFSWCSIESIQWGPEVQLSFPQPLQIGAVASCQGDLVFCHPNWKYYLDTGIVWLPLSSGTRNINEFSVELGTRYTPFSFPLTFAMGLGYRYLGLSTSDIGALLIGGSVAASTASINLSTWYLSPSVGWQFKLNDRLDLGIQFGVQLALIGDGSLFLVNDATGMNSNNSTLLSTDPGPYLGRVASLLIPTLTLVRLTWRFD